MRKRYEVMPVSASGAHEFNATVIDTHKTSYEKGARGIFLRAMIDHPELKSSVLVSFS